MDNNIEIRFPEDQQEGTEATVTRWLVADGDRVTAHDPVAEVETDKVVVEVAAPETGQITDIRIQQGEAVNPGDVLCILNTDIETSANTQETAGSTVVPITGSAPAKSTRLSPAVRKLVQAGSGCRAK